MKNHEHCPLDCYHPQPFETEYGVDACGKCFFVHNEFTAMVPCTPDICED